MVLDIFGFEFVDVEVLKRPDSTAANSFEQFCINLCNEELQQHFVTCELDKEQAVYKSELERTIKIDFKGNIDGLKVIHGRGTRGGSNILRKLEDCMKQQSDDHNKNDMTFHSKLEDVEKFSCSEGQKYKPPEDPKFRLLTHREKAFSEVYKKHPDFGFLLKHYAAEVLYDDRHWVEKNVAKETPEVYVAFTSAVRPADDPCYGNKTENFPVHHFTEGDKESHANSIATAFKSQLTKLIGELNHQTDCQFVRCIKTNKEKVADKYDTALVLNQLKYTGMLDTLEIRRIGYPVRMKHTEFMTKYFLLNTSLDIDNVSSFVQWIKTQQYYLDSDDRDDGSIHVGKTLVLMTDSCSIALNHERNRIAYASATIIQAAYNGFQHAKDYQARRRICKTMGPMLRGTEERVRFQKAYRDKFEKYERQRVARMIYATVQRQKFYELKANYIQVSETIKVLQAKSEESTVAHVAYITGLEAKLTQAAHHLANLKEDTMAAQELKAKSHQKDMSNLADVSKQLQQDLDLVLAQLDLEKEKRDQMAEACDKQEQDLTRSKLADAQHWEDQKQEELAKLKALEDRPSQIDTANEAHVLKLGQELEGIVEKNEEEEEELRRQVQTTISHSDEFNYELEMACHIQEKQKEEFEARMQKLDDELANIDERHAQEKQDLKVRLVHQNWELAQLRIKESKAEDHQADATYQRHGGLSSAAAQNKEHEVDYLEEKLTAVRHTLEYKKTQLERKMELVRAAMQAEQDAASAWDMAQRDHAQQCNAIGAAIAKEQEESHRLELEAQHAAPVLNKRTSRFAPPQYEELMRPAQYMLPAAPPQEPQQAPAQITDSSVYGYGRHRNLVLAAEDPPQPAGFMTDNQSACISALYSGDLRRGLPTGGFEGMDARTLEHTLRLLR